ncbi:hypothetical protein DPMN_060922 [Dreissena polymorpha]|uniref:Uncharacterized protein n=1 Tax=Dreissena polymorpha TaxID=45954 RepID=A0A9D4C6W2_DREPO|nr:hypothetical protein DPMN_060922 [Dreissena polymorpha]
MPMSTDLYFPSSGRQRVTHWVKNVSWHSEQPVMSWRWNQMMFEVCFRNKLPFPTARLIYQSAQPISDKTVSNFMEFFVERRSLLNENAV